VRNQASAKIPQVQAERDGRGERQSDAKPGARSGPQLLHLER
jgi:hypothetical protein